MELFYEDLVWMIGKGPMVVNCTRVEDGTDTVN